MSNEFSYSGYSGSCETSIEDGCLHGRILFIDDLVTYEGNTISELKTSFEAAVDRYVAYCAQTGKPANKPYSGNFNVRVNPNIHKAAAQRAQRDGVSLNQFIGRALEKEVNQTDQTEVMHHKVTVNHVVTHKQETIEVPYVTKESPWLQNPGKPRLKVVQAQH
ncbi:MAG: HicB family protein [Gallionellaceae bacterium]|nr:MAG: HicB family protein [Gallionellaceae bacterium]